MIHARRESLRQSESKRGKELELRDAGDVPEELGNRDDEQGEVRHADASGGYIIENQHRDVHVGKRGPEAAGEEQPDKLRKTVEFEQEAPSAPASSDPTVTLQYLARGETPCRPGSVLVQKSGHVDDDVSISVLNDQRMSDRHAVASGEDERHHDEKRMGDIHFGEHSHILVKTTVNNSIEVDDVNRELRLDMERLRHVHVLVHVRAIGDSTVSRTDAVIPRREGSPQ